MGLPKTTTNNAQSDVRAGWLRTTVEARGNAGSQSHMREEKDPLSGMQAKRKEGILGASSGLCLHKCSNSVPAYVCNIVPRYDLIDLV